MLPKTKSQKTSQVERQWHIIDAAQAPLGRIASAAAKLLIGKHKPSYTPHVDGGDGVIIINSDRLQLTGRKIDQKRYFRHSGYPGGIKSYTAGQLQVKDSAKMVHLAVKGMLPKNKLQDLRLARLRIFKGSEHNLEAQKPTAYEVKSND